MPEAVVRSGGITDQMQRSRRSAELFLLIVYIWLAGSAAWIIWKGGFAGLVVVLVLGALVAIWISIDDAIGRWRLRRFLRADRFSLPVENATPITGSIDAWMLLKGGFEAIAFDRVQGVFWFFRSRKRAYRFDVSAFRRIEHGVRKTWYGKTVDILRLSDAYAGPSLDLAVREGDIDHFLRIARQQA